MSERKILHSWKEIANYLDIGVRTAQRYEALYGMPVHRPAGKDRSAVLALCGELDGWLNNTPKRTSTKAAAASVDATAELPPDGYTDESKQQNLKPSGGARPFLVWVTRHGGHVRRRELVAAYDLVHLLSWYPIAYTATLKRTDTPAVHGEIETKTEIRRAMIAVRFTKFASIGERDSADQ